MSAPIDPAVLLQRGAHVAVVAFDGKQTTVLVRLLSLAEFRDFILLIEDFSRLAEFVAGQPAGWADIIQPASVMDVVEKALDLNFSLARRWAALRAKLHAAVGSGSLPPADPSPPSSSSSAPTPGS